MNYDKPMSEQQSGLNNSIIGTPSGGLEPTTPVSTGLSRQIYLLEIMDNVLSSLENALKPVLASSDPPTADPDNAPSFGESLHATAISQNNITISRYIEWIRSLADRLEV